MKALKWDSRRERGVNGRDERTSFKYPSTPCLPEASKMWKIKMQKSLSVSSLVLKTA